VNWNSPELLIAKFHSRSARSGNYGNSSLSENFGFPNRYWIRATRAALARSEEQQRNVIAKYRGFQLREVHQKT
jgi:hypothetical protein